MTPVRRLSSRPDGARASDEPRPRAAGVRADRRVLLLITVAVLAIAGGVALISTTIAPGVTTTGSISVSSGANTIVGSALRTNPAGFTLESSRQPPSVSSDWAVLQQKSDGSEANVTVIVFSSTNASQAYFSSFVAGVRGLPGYTDVTSGLASFQRYGGCYGYGEDVDNIAVINGICTKGNVLLQVHLVSSISFSSLESDLTSIMGALYESAV